MTVHIHALLLNYSIFHVKVLRYGYGGLYIMSGTLGEMGLKVYEGPFSPQSSLAGSSVPAVNSV